MTFIDCFIMRNFEKQHENAAIKNEKRQLLLVKQSASNQVTVIFMNEVPATITHTHTHIYIYIIVRYVLSIPNLLFLRILVRNDIIIPVSAAINGKNIFCYLHRLFLIKHPRYVTRIFVL